MAQASQFRPSITLWTGFAIRAPQCGSTIDDSTIFKATCKRLDKEVAINRKQYYERGLSTGMKNMVLKSIVDSTRERSNILVILLD